MTPQQKTIDGILALLKRSDEASRVVVQRYVKLTHRARIQHLTQAGKDVTENARKGAHLLRAAFQSDDLPWALWGLQDPEQLTKLIKVADRVLNQVLDKGGPQSNPDNMLRLRCVILAARMLDELQVPRPKTSGKVWDKVSLTLYLSTDAPKPPHNSLKSFFNDAELALASPHQA